MPTIKEINYGIACRIKNTIYIHKNLHRFPQLRARLLQHEAEHSQGYTKKDVMMDLNNKSLKGVKTNYYMFILTHPSSWIEFLPFWFYEGRCVWNPTLCVFYVILIMILMGLLL